MVDSLIEFRIGSRLERLEKALGELSAQVEELPKKLQQPELERLEPTLNAVQAELRQLAIAKPQDQSHSRKRSKELQKPSPQLAELSAKMDRLGLIEEKISAALKIIKALQETVDQSSKMTLAVANQLQQKDQASQRLMRRLTRQRQREPHFQQNQNGNSH